MPVQVWLLFVIAALVLSSSPLLILVGGIAGHELSPSEALKTLPIAGFVVGAACATYPAIRAMGRFGRKRIFLFAGVLFGGAALAIAAALQLREFYAFCLACVGLGAAFACFGQLRFAAMELVPANLAPKAAARIMLAGLVAALLGPQLGVWGEQIYHQPFVGGFVLLALFAVAVVVLVVIFYREPARPCVVARSAGRPMTEIAQSPAFLLAVGSSAAAFAVMSLIMTATPLTMHVHHHFELERTKEVIQGHIFAMFFPSLFTGLLISHWGEARVIVLGMGCFVAAIMMALAGTALLNFWVALILLGLGWNFMFIGGTSLLPKAYRAEERFRVQSVNDALILGCQALASLGAGWLLNLWGWQLLLLACLPLLAPCALALMHNRRTSLADAANATSNSTAHQITKT